MLTYFHQNKFRYEKGQLAPIFIVLLVILIIMAGAKEIMGAEEEYPDTYGGSKTSDLEYQPTGSSITMPDVCLPAVSFDVDSSMPNSFTPAPSTFSSPINPTNFGSGIGGSNGWDNNSYYNSPNDDIALPSPIYLAAHPISNVSTLPSEVDALSTNLPPLITTLPGGDSITGQKFLEPEPISALQETAKAFLSDGSGTIDWEKARKIIGIRDYTEDLRNRPEGLVFSGLTAVADKSLIADLDSRLTPDVYSKQREAGLTDLDFPEWKKQEILKSAEVYSDAGGVYITGHGEEVFVNPDPWLGQERIQHYFGNLKSSDQEPDYTGTPRQIMLEAIKRPQNAVDIDPRTVVQRYTTVVDGSSATGVVLAEIGKGEVLIGTVEHGVERVNNGNLLTMDNRTYAVQQINKDVPRDSAVAWLEEVGKPELKVGDTWKTTATIAGSDPSSKELHSLYLPPREREGTKEEFRNVEIPDDNSAPILSGAFFRRYPQHNTEQYPSYLVTANTAVRDGDSGAPLWGINGEGQLEITGFVHVGSRVRTFFMKPSVFRDAIGMFQDNLNEASPLANSPQDGPSVAPQQGGAGGLTMPGTIPSIKDLLLIPGWNFKDYEIIKLIPEEKPWQPDVGSKGNVR